jgi:phosphate-selective porin OprO/OprP
MMNHTTTLSLLLLLSTAPVHGEEQTSQKTSQQASLSDLEARLQALLQQIHEAQEANGSSETDESTEAAPPATAASVLESRLEELDQKVRILERQLEIEKEQAKERASQTPAVGASREGFQFRSGDGNFNLRVRGYLQADGLFVESEGADAATSTFLMRRVRPVFEATMFKRFDFKVMPDFGMGTTVLQDGYLDARFTPKFALRAGKYKSPFGLERLASATDLLFVERGLPTGLAPNRDVGVMLHGDVAKSRLSYQAGLFNGVVDGGSADLDSGDGKDFVGRIMTHPFRGAAVFDGLQSLGVGLAASVGTQQGSLTAPNLPNLRRQSRASYFRYRVDGTLSGTTIADGDRRRLSPQGYFYSGSLGLLWEYVWTLQDVRRAEAADTIDSRAWQVAGSWVLTGETPSYRGVSPRRPFEPSQGGWGAFEIAARVGRLTIGEDAFPIFANPETSARDILAYTIGLNWYLNRSFKVVVNYEEARFDGGSPPSSDRGTERDFLTRLQFSF